MRKFSILSLIVILALILTACAGGDAGDTGETGVEGFGTPAVGDGGLSEDITTPSVSESGGDLTGTQTVEGGIVPPVGTDVVGQTPGAVSEATRQPTATLSSGGTSGGEGSSGTATQSPTLSGTAGGVATQSPTQTGGLGSVIPVTGAFQFVRASELLGYQVMTNDTSVSGSTGTQTTNPTVAPTVAATSGASGQSSTVQSPTQSATRSVSGTPGSVLGGGQLVGIVEDFVVAVAPQNGESSSGSSGSIGSTGSSVSGTATPATGGTGVSTVSPSGTATPSSGGTSGTGSGMTGSEFGSLDVQNGEIVFIVVQVDDSVELGDTTNDLVAIPWQNVRVDVDNQVIYVDFPMSRIQEAPAFSSTDWPDVSMAGWETEWVTFWFGSSVSE